MHAQVAPVPRTASPTGPLLVSLDREQPFTPLRIEGALPVDLRGTLYRNGPARFDIGPRPHWFDGTGAITAVRFADGAAQGAVRLVHTPSNDTDATRATPRYGAFRQKAAPLQRLRGLFGAPLIRNAANINVLPWQGRLFALYEATLPLEIDPLTLASIGETRLDGVIPAGWNAHPRRVARHDTTYQFGLRFGARCYLDVFALPARGAARRLVSIPLPGVMEAHDFFATERHLVFVLPPLHCAPLALLRNGSFVESLRWHADAPTTIIVIPIAEPSAWFRCETEPFFFWHGVNAYEAEERGEIVLDLVRYPDFACTKRSLDAISDSHLPVPAAPNGLWRGRLDLARRCIAWEPRWQRPLEFPAVLPAQQGAVHESCVAASVVTGGTAAAGYTHLANIDITRGDASFFDPGADCQVSEPTLVARAGGGAYLLSLLQDRAAGASCLALWDAGHRESPPLARVWFDQLLPAPLHGCWVGES